MGDAIDLNADLGETVDGVPTADDDAMFALVSSANVACGGHAGDAESMRASVERARREGTAVGAHPSYPDRQNFGRLAMPIDQATLQRSLDAQLDALAEAGADIRYVKAHGALYNMAAHDEEHAAAIAGAAARLSRDLGRELTVFGLGGRIERAVERAGLPFAREAFLDRGYAVDGALIPRAEPGAVLHDPEAAARRAVRIARDGEVDAVDGSVIQVAAVTLCVHGDTAEAVAMARGVRDALADAGIEVRAPW